MDAYIKIQPVQFTVLQDAHLTLDNGLSFAMYRKGETILARNPTAIQTLSKLVGTGIIKEGADVGEVKRSKVTHPGFRK